MTDHRDGDGDEDRKAILSRRRLLIATALSSAGVAVGAARAQPPMACLSRLPPPPRVRFSRAPGRRSTPLERVPSVIRGALSDHTIYAAGGGLTSTAWRIVLDLRGTIMAGRGDTPGGPSHGRLPIAWSGRVGEDVLHELVQLADRAWREERSPNLDPTADYDEVLAMRDGSDVFFAQGFGPLRGGATEQLIARLRQVAEHVRPTER